MRLGRIQGHISLRIRTLLGGVSEDSYLNGRLSLFVWCAICYKAPGVVQPSLSQFQRLIRALCFLWSQPEPVTYLLPVWYKYMSEAHLVLAGTCTEKVSTDTSQYFYGCFYLYEDVWASRILIHYLAGPQEPLRFEPRNPQTAMVSKTSSKNQTICGFWRTLALSWVLRKSRLDTEHH